MHDFSDLSRAQSAPRPQHSEKGMHPEGAWIDACVGPGGFEVFALETKQDSAGQGGADYEHGWRQDVGYGPAWDPTEPVDCPYYLREIERLDTLGFPAYVRYPEYQDSVGFNVPWKKVRRISACSEFGPLLVRAFDAKVRLPLSFVEQLAHSPTDVVDLDSLDFKFTNFLLSCQSVFRWKARKAPRSLVQPLDAWVSASVPWQRRMVVVNAFGWLDVLNEILDDDELTEFFRQPEILPFEWRVQ